MSASAKAPTSSNPSSGFAGKGSAPEPHTPPENPESISLCYLHLRDKKGRDVNQNVVAEEARPRTKSDPTPKGASCQPGSQGEPDPPEVCRSRSFTMDSQVNLEGTQFYCDSCKAKLKNRSGGGGMDVKCVNSCGSSTCRDNSVDLISLPPPENKKHKEEQEGRRKGEGLAVDRDVGETATFLPSAAPPPPGFGDNSSDEEDQKRTIEKGHEKGREHKKANVNPVFGYEELPVTLIDSVQTRTVRDHARELDDALVSTLQALEALAASEDYPSAAPQSTAGLIVLAAITPESSLDSGHETNSSELTDVSEMVTALKQHHNTAYFLAHHLNKESLISRKDLPFRIQTCAAQAVLASPYSLGRETSPLLKPTLLQQSFTGTSLQQASVPSSPKCNLNNGGSILTSPKKPDKPTEGTSATAPTEPSKIKQNLPKRSSNTATDSTEDSSGAGFLSANPIVQSTLSAMLNDRDSEKEKKSLDSPCGCRLSPGEPSALNLDKPVNGNHEVLNLSPTDDERLHAKACSVMSLEEKHLSHKRPDKREITKTHVDDVALKNVSKRKQEDVEKDEKKEHVPSIPNIFMLNTDNAKVKVKSETDKAVAPTIPEKVPAPVELDECAKPRNRGPLKLRKLFSATFPTRMRRETDERQAQLRKVKQYEMEFLEELLRPQGKIGGPRQEILYPLVPRPCSCQVRSSPLQKVPGMSREQRRSCDCKRITRGIHVPPSSSVEPEPRNRPRGRGKGHPRLVRSSSLESRGSEKLTSCLSTGKTLAESAVHSSNLPQKLSASEVKKKEVPCNPPSAKPQKKEVEPPVFKSKTTDLMGNREERKPLVTLPVEEEVFAVQSKLPAEENIIPGEKCCSIRHCFNCRRCSSADESSDRDELSYSIPMQILPGINLNSETTPLLSQTLQVLDASVCSAHEDNQTQEIDLRTATFEGSLAKVNALHGRSYSLPDGFMSVQRDTSELLTVLRQCVVSTETGEPKLDSMHLSQRKQELTMRFKEFRASCRRMAGVDKNPEHMLTAVTCSFQVLCSLIETFVKLVFLIRSESQRQELLAKVEEVVRNYTFLLRAAEESSTRTVAQCNTVVGQLAKQSATVATAVSTFSRSIKSLMSKQ